MISDHKALNFLAICPVATRVIKSTYYIRSPPSTNPPLALLNVHAIAYATLRSIFSCEVTKIPWPENSPT